MLPTILSISLLSIPTLSLAAHVPRRHAHDLSALDSRGHGNPALLSGRGIKPARRLVKKSKKSKRASCPVGGGNGGLGNSTITTTSSIGENTWATPSSSTETPSSTTTSSSSSDGESTSSTTAPESSSTTTTSSESSSTTTSSTTSTASSTATGSSDWVMTDNWSGSSFFDNFNFWNGDDPTHGTVDYQDASGAWNSGLVWTNNGHAFMKVDTTQQASGRGRKSVRIHGNKIYNGGMILMDAYHMPTGCGTWPAWWSLGPNWPYGGEIDILEGVNAFEQNQVSLHTGSGCTMPQNQNSLQQGTLTTGSFDSYNCASYETANQGCGVRDMTNDNSYGTGFNNGNGGVYALIWAKSGISVYFFPRNSIPSDITNETPDPSGWGTPIADFPGDNCDPMSFFSNHYSIFDTTLCGDWAGADAVWNYAGYAGQDQSCASITGYSTCSDFVWNNGAAFQDAFWEVAYVKYFTSPTQV